MPWTHHSHSGQFCGHAVNTLEEVVLAAITRGMTTLCLTEHMPREQQDFYPEERKTHTEESLGALYDAFYVEARRLQHAHSEKIEIFVGFEGEWIRPSSRRLIQNLMAKHPVDLFVGSVHHTLCHPIDYDHDMYHAARAEAGGTDEAVAARYFDEQFDMLQQLQPPIVGHFDLIRLKSDGPDESFQRWPLVWSKILRNLHYVAEYGGVLELNSSSLRKGMSEAYPQVEICTEFKTMGGRFTLSDDSHGIDHVGLNYDKVLQCVERAGITELHHLQRTAEAGEKSLVRFPGIRWNTIAVDDLKCHAFWTQSQVS